MLSKQFFIRTLCCLVVSSHAYAIDLNIHVLDQQGAPLADIVAYLEPLEGQATLNTSQQVVISQSDKSFTPYISVTQVGNPFTFNNQDDITHHIYSANKTNQFSFLIKPGQKIQQLASTHPEEVAMGCNVHDWMSGHLLVLDTPYFAKTDDQGRANISVDLPGKYALVVWHPQLQSADNRQRQQIHISVNRDISLQLNAKMAKIPEQKSLLDFDFLSDY